MELTFEMKPAHGAWVLRCHGRITSGREVDGFSQKVAELLSLPRQLVVDLSEVEIIDRAGLGELVIVLMWAQASGCELKLAAPSLQVYQLLELTSLLSVFETHATVDEAVLSFRQSPKKAKAAACTAA